MSVFERIALFIPRFSWPFLMLPLLLPVISWMAEGGREAVRIALVTLMAMSFSLSVFLSPYWLYRILQIRRSRGRVAGIPVRELVSPAVAGWSIVLVAGLIIAAGAFGYIPNIFITRAIEKSRSRAEAQLNRIQAIDGRLTEATITSEKWDEASIMKATGVVPDVRNLAIMHRENLGDLTRNLLYPRAMRVVFCNAYDTIAAASLVRKGKWPAGDPIRLFDSSDRVRELLDLLDRLRYLLVVRQTAYQPPAMTRPGTFASGEYDADVLLFDIQRGRYLAGFKIGAENSFKVESTTIDVEALERDLSVNAENSLKAGLAQHLPAVAKDEEFCRH